MRAIIAVVGLLTLVAGPALAQNQVLKAGAGPAPTFVTDPEAALLSAQGAMWQAEARYYLELAKHFERLNAKQATERAAVDRYWGAYVAGLAKFAPPASSPGAKK